jgi:TetR/AcrR family transcriptional regulator, transcriptional repressor for nem operon
VRERVQGCSGRLEQIVSKAIGSAAGKPVTIDAHRPARVAVTFTRGLAVMERAGYSRKQLKESAATFVGAMVSG